MSLVINFFFNFSALLACYPSLCANYEHNKV